jgi:hypothetical protein
LSKFANPKALRRSNVVVSKLRANSRARCQESLSSVGVGLRAISAYLSRYGARRIAEIFGMELRHHIHRRRRHVLGNPFEHRIRAALDVIGHHQVPDGKILAQSASSARLRVTVFHYQGVFASVIAQRPGPNLKSGSQTSVSTRRIFMLSSVMKKLLFQSIGALNFPS